MMLRVGDKCPCHTGQLFTRPIIEIDAANRKFCCSPKPEWTNQRSWHWFDEAAWALKKKGQVLYGFQVEPVETENEYGEVTP